MAYVYIFYWTFPKFDGQSEGQFIRAEPCENVPDALVKAAKWFATHPNAKCEIVQVPEPLPEEFLWRGTK